jgi:hypothetical protein
MHLKPSAFPFKTLAAASMIAASLFAAGCDTTDSKETTTTPTDTTKAADSTIVIMSPATAGTYKLSEKFKMVVKCDYSKFASGLNFQLSKDSAKTWELIVSKVRKEGIEKDTLEWDPINDLPGDVPVGKPVKIRVIDYNKTHFAISKDFTFTN